MNFNCGRMRKINAGALSHGEQRAKAKPLC